MIMIQPPKLYKGWKKSQTCSYLSSFSFNIVSINKLEIRRMTDKLELQCQLQKCLQHFKRNIVITFIMMKAALTRLSSINLTKKLEKWKIQIKQYLRPDASDCREAWIAASSYAEGAWAIGCVWGGVKSGTLFSARGGNSTPAACQLYKSSLQK